jgi:hypothetical protein
MTDYTEEATHILNQYGEYYHLAALNKFTLTQMAYNFPDEVSEINATAAILALTEEAYKAGYNDAMDKKQPKFLLGYDHLNLLVEDAHDQPKEVDCPTCNGNTTVQNEESGGWSWCDACNGSGKVKQS